LRMGPPWRERKGPRLEQSLVLSPSFRFASLESSMLHGECQVWIAGVAV
jgi:hypothetical protein